jgi:hypothetical protein
VPFQGVHPRFFSLLFPDGYGKKERKNKIFILSIVDASLLLLDIT